MSTASQSSKNILMIFPYLWWYFRRYPIFPAIVLIVLAIFPVGFSWTNLAVIPGLFFLGLMLLERLYHIEAI